MSEPKTIEVTAEVTPSPEPAKPVQALAVIEQGGAVGKPMTPDELHAQLEFIRTVMKREMKDGVDYGKIPGCGDKPGLFQPGAQKLLMTFRLTDHVKKEVLREFPNYHREYEFTVSLRSQAGREWDGVGTCSTLESKYRYRKAERTCPKCGHAAIIEENPKFLKPGQVAGFVCWKKKGGCNFRFAPADPAITSQIGGQVENENPADQWNTVRKMAFKRALVAAAINATNTSELWTQDIEDLNANAAAAPESAPKPAPASSSPPQGERPRQPAQQTAAAPPLRLASIVTRNWTLQELGKKFGPEAEDSIHEYLVKAGMLLETENITELPPRWGAVNADQFKRLVDKIKGFLDGEKAERPYPPNQEKQPADPKKGAKATPPRSEPIEPPPQEHEGDPDPEWWRDVIVPIPHKGEKRDDYMKNPETLGQLYDKTHEQTADGQDARQRLFGFATHFEPKGWTKRSGEEMSASESDKAFRVALDAFMDWHEKNHPDDKL